MIENHRLNEELILSWMSMTTAPIHYTKVCDGQFDSKEYWSHLRVLFHRMQKKGLVESVGSRDGMYRLVDDSARPIDWQGYDAHTDSGVLLPFDIRKYVFIYPESTIIVCGEKSGGKTGFIYRTMAMNMLNRKCILLTNLEGGIGMLKDRFEAMDIEIPNPAPFEVRPVYENYHDYIKEANAIYFVDYIAVPDSGEFYMIAPQIKRIDRKLKGLNSLAVVGLQKPPGRDIAYGGPGTLDVATLYIALSANKLKIVDAKVPADKKLHPKNMTFTFQYGNEGTNFMNIQRSYESEEF